MPRNYNRYQYETSPRKLEPEYLPPKNPYKGRKSVSKRATNNAKQKQEKLKKQKRKAVKYTIIGFIILFGLCYRNSQIDENFAKTQNLKEELSNIEKQNAQLKVSIENSMNLSNIEQQAKELLGMQKLNSKQTVFVTLPKTDYIQPAGEEVIIEEEKPLVKTIIDNIGNLFK